MQSTESERVKTKINDLFQNNKTPETIKEKVYKLSQKICSSPVMSPKIIYLAVFRSEAAQKLIDSEEETIKKMHQVNELCAEYHEKTFIDMSFLPKDILHAGKNNKSHEIEKNELEK